MPSIRQALLISVPAATVYDAITTQEGLAAWWTPGAKAKPEHNSVAEFWFGPDYHKEMRIVRLEPPRAVEWLCLHGDEEWIGTKLRFEMTGDSRAAISKSNPEASGQVAQAKRDEGTLLSFSHDDWKTYSPTFAECSYTWGRFLRSLKLYCEIGKGHPWPHEHETTRQSA